MAGLVLALAHAHRMEAHEAMKLVFRRVGRGRSDFWSRRSGGRKCVFTVVGSSFYISYISVLAESYIGVLTSNKEGKVICEIDELVLGAVQFGELV